MDKNKILLQNRFTDGFLLLLHVGKDKDIMLDNSL